MRLNVTRLKKKNTRKPITIKKEFLRILNGNMLIFDIENDISIYYIKKSKKKKRELINSNSINWHKFENLISTLEKSILIYAPYQCSTWIIAHDQKAAKKAK